MWTGTAGDLAVHFRGGSDGLSTRDSPWTLAGEPRLPVTCEGSHRGSSQEHRFASERNHNSKSVLFLLDVPPTRPGRHVFEIITDSLMPFDFKGQSALPAEQGVHLQSQPHTPVKEILSHD